MNIPNIFARLGNRQRLLILLGVPVTITAIPVLSGHGMAVALTIYAITLGWFAVNLIYPFRKAGLYRRTEALYCIGFVLILAQFAFTYDVQHYETDQLRAKTEKLVGVYEMALSKEDSTWLVTQNYTTDLSKIGEFFPSKQSELQGKLDKFYSRDDIKVQVRAFQAEQLTKGNNWAEALATLREAEQSPSAPADLKERMTRYRKEGEKYYLEQAAKTDTTDNHIKTYASLVQIAPDNKDYKAMLAGFKRIKEKQLVEQEQEAKEFEQHMKHYGKPPEQDGSYLAVKRYLKAVARDPDSVEIEGCTKMSKQKNGWGVGCDYRGKNGFGGYTREFRLFIIDNGQVVEVKAIR